MTLGGILVGLRLNEEARFAEPDHCPCDAGYRWAELPGTPSSAYVCGQHLIKDMTLGLCIGRQKVKNMTSHPVSSQACAAWPDSIA